MFRGGNEGSFGDVWAATPIFYKCLVFIVGGLSIIGILTSIFVNFFIMIPALVFRFQIWRLFTSWMIELSIINAIFGLLSLYYYFPTIVEIIIFRKKSLALHIL